MVMDKIEKIKEAEENAEDIIKRAEEEGIKIKENIQDMEEKFRQEKEKLLKKEIENYKEAKEKEKEQELKKIEDMTNKMIEDIKKSTENKIDKVIEDALKTLKDEVFMH
ncbi:MAG TPA: hypothetical protein PLW95_02505 [bacterium]|nr:hypothetical protein [bacterium]